MNQALTFDDVLLVPQPSRHSPASVSTEVFLTKRIKLGIPLLSAAMDTVTESEMAIALATAGGLGIIHKNMDPLRQASEVKKVKAKGLLCGAAVSAGDEAVRRARILAGAGADVIVIDVAHGHYYKIAETLRILKKLFRGKVVLIGGNVATGQATADLIKAGADVVKVGVGPGSICTTRVISGVGVPQITAIANCAKVAERHDIPIIGVALGEPVLEDDVELPLLDVLQGFLTPARQGYREAVHLEDAGATLPETAVVIDQQNADARLDLRGDRQRIPGGVRHGRGARSVFRRPDV